MLITEQLLLKLDMLSQKYSSNFTKFLSNFCSFGQLLSNFKFSIFQSNFLAVSEENMRRMVLTFEENLFYICGQVVSSFAIISVLV